MSVAENQCLSDSSLITSCICFLNGLWDGHFGQKMLENRALFNRVTSGIQVSCCSLP